MIDRAEQYSCVFLTTPTPPHPSSPRLVTAPDLSHLPRLSQETNSRDIKLLGLKLYRMVDFLVSVVHMNEVDRVRHRVAPAQQEVQ